MLCLESSDNCWVTSFNSDAAFVGTTFDERVTLLSPSGSPLVTDDPVRSGTAHSVANDNHFVVKAVVIFFAS